MRTFTFILLVTWATLQGSLSLWGFYHDAARRDFGHFVSSAITWRDNGFLYDNVPRVNLNPPHASVVLFTPLTWISFDSAVRFWLVLQIGTFITGIILIAKELNVKSARLEWIVPVVAASAMMNHNWIEGQVGGLLLVGGALAWIAVRRHKQSPGSIILAGLVNLKPQLGLMLFAIGWPTQLRVLLLGGALALAGLVLVGSNVWISWIEATRGQGLQLLPWNVSVAPTLYRIGATSAMPYLYLASAVLIAGITWSATLRDANHDRRWLLWGLAMLLIGPVSWVYYAAVFLGPLISWGERYQWPLAAMAGILLWLIPLQTMSWVGTASPGWKAGIIGSPYTWGAILLWLSVLASTNQPDRPLLVELQPTL